MVATEQEIQNLIDAYVQSFGHHASVAKQVSIPLHQAMSFLNGLGLPNLSLRGSKTNPRAAVEAYRIRGKSSIESAAIGGLTADEMDDLNRKSGPHLNAALTAMAARAAQQGTSFRRKKALLPRAFIANESSIQANRHILETELQN